MKKTIQSLVRSVFGLLLVSGVATAAVAASTKPAEAGVVISIQIGEGGYAPAYRPYARPYGYGHHRRYGPAAWVASPIYPAYGYPVYGRPYGARFPAYVRPYRAGYARYDYGRGAGPGYYYGRHERDYGYAGRRY